MLSEHKWTECPPGKYVKKAQVKFDPRFIARSAIEPGERRPFQPARLQLHTKFKPTLLLINNPPPELPKACKLEALTKDYLNDRRLPSPWYWNSEEVANWIEDIGYPQYRACFAKNFISGRNLVGLEAKHFPILNITNFDHIKKISAAIRALFDDLLQTRDPKIWEPPMHPIALYMLYKPYTTMKMVDFLRHWHIIPNTRGEKLHFHKCVFEVARYYTTHKMDQYLFENNVPVKLPNDATSFLQSNNFYW